MILLLLQVLCPYCEGDAARMTAAGIVSHEPRDLGPRGPDGAFTPLPDGPRWIHLETAHLRWASSLGPESLSADEARARREEIDRLRAVLPKVPKNPRKLDPWLRLHLLAARGEAFYARFQRLLQVTDADFPEQRRAGGPFMGDGPFLGEAGKYEIVLHERRVTHQEWTGALVGVRVTDALRWHFTDPHKILASIPCEDSDLRRDRWLWPHLVHNLSHNLLDGYKHFSYDSPAWLSEGLALSLEKEVEPLSFTREGEEGTYKERQPQDWRGRAARIARGGRAPTFATLLHKATTADFGDDDLLAAWSMVDFLAATRPEAFAALLGGVKGQLDERGYPTGRDLPGLQTRLLREHFGWAPTDLDRAWREWASGAESGSAAGAGPAGEGAGTEG